MNNQIKFNKWVVKNIVIMLILSVFVFPTFAKEKQSSNQITNFTLTASSAHQERPIINAHNGKYDDCWETDWLGSQYTPSEANPIVVIAKFDQPTEVGKMRIVQRKGYNQQNGDANGRFIKARYSKIDENGKVIGTPITETYAKANEIPKDDDIYVGIYDKVKEVKIEILAAYHTTASIAEIEFYEKKDDWFSKVSATTEHPNHPITYAFDQDENTMWHSDWEKKEVTALHPADVIITRKEVHPMSKLVYTPRKNNGEDGDQNGIILLMEIYTSSNQKNWKKLNQVEWNAESGVKSVDLFGNTDRYVKLHITKGVANSASAGEFFIEEITDKEQIDTSIITVVEKMNLSPKDPKGWDINYVKRLSTALKEAKHMQKNGTVTELLIAINTLKQTYQELIPDKQGLQDKIEEAKQIDLAFKSIQYVTNLKQAIAHAEQALEIVKTPLEVQFEITQLESAMNIMDQPVLDIQNVTSMDSIKRDQIFNEGWLFQETTEQSYAQIMDESQFKQVNLPHDFSIHHDFTTSGEAESGFLLGGTGWYRKHIILPKTLENKQIRLIFDGAYMDTTVYVNGKEVGQNHHGYNQFAFDITKQLVCDGKTDNVIAVKVVNDLPSSRWYSGSGIYRDVTLQITNPTHIDYLGTFVATPKDNEVIIENKVVGRNHQTKIQTIIYDKEGKQVVDTGIKEIKQDVVKEKVIVTNPHLWSPDDPYRYQAITKVFQDEQEVDMVETMFGFKQIRFDREKGLYLNNQNIKLQGVCMHHDQGALGAVSNYHAVYRQMKIMKEMGVNAVRVTHNPSSEMFLEICDELGILVINESFDHLYYSKNNNSNDFARWFKKEIGSHGPLGSTTNMTWAEYVAKQMVKVSRNHPSILMYSVGNELLEGGRSDQGYVDTVSKICDWFHEVDPYHKPTIGDNKAKGNEPLAVQLCEAVAKKGGIIGFNYANTQQYQDLRKKHPDWILYGSETSSAFHSRNVYHTDFKDLIGLLCTDYENELSRAGWGHSASTAWKFVEENPWNLGEFVWTGFDYLGEPTPWNNIGVGSITNGKPAPRSSYFGIVETTGFEKDIYYLYQSIWNHRVHTLHMSERWNDDLLKVGDKVVIQVFTDAPKVTLYLDGKELESKTSYVKKNGTRQFDQRYFAEFHVSYRPGTLSVKAFKEDGSEILDTVGIKEIATTKKATHTVLSANKQVLESDGYDLAYVTVDLVDDQKHFVSDASQKLYFTLEGEGKIVGIDNGNQTDTQSFRIDNDKRASRNSFNGKALVIIQSTKRTGDMKLQVKGVGLQDNEIILSSKSSSSSHRLSAVELQSNYSTHVNKMIELPKTVTGIFENGQEKELSVIWDLSEFHIERAGHYVIKGTLDGYEFMPTITVNVYHEFEGVQQYSTVINEKEPITLPQTRKVYYKDGSIAGQFPVIWDYFNPDEFKAGNTYEVNGAVVEANQKLSVKALIRVVNRLPEAKNIARLPEDMPTLSQSCIKPADQLSSLNNGIKTSDQPEERWTDWNEKEQVKPWVSYTWKKQYLISDIIAYLYQDDTSTIPKEMELEVETLDEKGNWIQQEISYITPVAYYDGDGKTTINLKKPIKTNGVKLHINKKKTPSFTGLTELEVFEYIEKVKPKNQMEISKLMFNDKVFNEFQANKESYEVQVNQLPDFSSLKVTYEIDPTATAVVLKDPYQHTVRIIVTAENKEEKTYKIHFIQSEQANGEIEHGSSSNQSGQDSLDNPKTGDQSNVTLLWIVLMITTGLFALKKTKKYSE